VAIYFVTLSIV